MKKEHLSVGQRVHYCPDNGPYENGIIKSITDAAVFVVYNCGGNWDRYWDYTAANTNPRDLATEWVNDARNA
jgi:hypothetical protein